MYKYEAKTHWDNLNGFAVTVFPSLCPEEAFATQKNIYN